MTGALTAQLGQRLDGLALLALFLDGVVGAGQTVIVVLGLTRDGEKKPLGLPLRLRRFFATTSCIENVLGTVRRVTRDIARWRDGAMIRRWVGLAPGRAATRFRRIKGHREFATLATAPRKAAEAAA